MKPMGSIKNNTEIFSFKFDALGSLSLCANFLFGILATNVDSLNPSSSTPAEAIHATHANHHRIGLQQ